MPFLRRRHARHVIERPPITTNASERGHNRCLSAHQRFLQPLAHPPAGTTLRYRLEAPSVRRVNLRHSYRLRVCEDAVSARGTIVQTRILMEKAVDGGTLREDRARYARVVEILGEHCTGMYVEYREHAGIGTVALRRMRVTSSYWGSVDPEDVEAITVDALAADAHCAVAEAKVVLEEVRARLVTEEQARIDGLAARRDAIAEEQADDDRRRRLLAEIAAS